MSSAGFDLAVALEHARHYLPAQNPLERFVHHNTLHAFESHRFDDALALAAEVYGAASYMPEAEYRACLATGRIDARDIAAVLEEALPTDEAVAGVSMRRLAELALRHGVDDVDDAALEFELSEGSALLRWRPDLPSATRRALLLGAAPSRLREVEAARVQALYRAAQVALTPACHGPNAGAAVNEGARASARRLLQADDMRRAKLIRWAAAYLDCGVADWAPPGRTRGFLTIFREVALATRELPSDLLSAAGRFARAVPDEDADACALRCLDALHVPSAERAEFVRRTLLELPGWAGMFARVEERPDQLPGENPPPATLLDFLAVSLLLEVASRQVAQRAPSGALSPGVSTSLPAPVRSSALDSYRLFRLAQLLGLDATALSKLAPPDVAALLAAWESIDAATRLRWFHAAYERHHEDQVLDQVAAHLSELRAGRAPRAGRDVVEGAFAQVVCCIDDREESLRRHLEELDPKVETFAAAGFFGVAMAYQAHGQREAFPLCPPVTTPRHRVREERVEGPAPRALLPATKLRVLRPSQRKASHTLARGALAALTGAIAFAPMSAGVLAPRLRARWAAERRTHGTTRLALLRTDDALEDGLANGFSHAEMADIVHGLLAPMGILPELAPLVLILGHGSHSENNPQAAAYNCGACAGGHGGPNARAFAQMANSGEVREQILERHGVALREDTWFVGGNHDTADEAITLYDLDLIPDAHRDGLSRLVRSLDAARIADAEERCRTFATGIGKTGLAALRHVQARAEDLAQPRPELGHARNAVCVVGRRTWTRGLDLDRRAFLVSYDPSVERGDLLPRLLGAVVPVCAGISLEYYFSYVDPQRYGAGTKLPHNLSGLLGVMDGHASDLRTGLPWQMVEVHEPVRLLFVIEAKRETFLAALEADPNVSRLVRNEWVRVSLIDPDDHTLYLFRRGTFVRREASEAVRRAS